MGFYMQQVKNILNEMQNLSNSVATEGAQIVSQDDNGKYKVELNPKVHRILELSKEAAAYAHLAENETK